MKKLLLFMLGFSFISHVSAQELSASAASAVRNPAVLSKVIDEPVDFTWQEDIAKFFGFKTISFKKGRYVIRKSKASPYGTVTLNVTGAVPLTPGMKQISRRQQLGCVPKGYQCRDEGFSCLIFNDPDFPTTFSTKTSHGKLNTITITFIKAGVTNGEKFPSPKVVYVNPENPFDDAGRMHNEMLDSISRSPQFAKIRSAAIKGNKDYVKEFIDWLLNRTDLPGEFKQLMRKNPAKMTAATNMNAMNASVNVRRYGTQLLALSKRISSKKEISSADFLPLIRFEKMILKQKGISEADKKTILTMSAVARYSNYYWSDVLSDPGAGWNLQAVAKEKKKADKDRLAVADAIGTLGGPAGTVAASAVDALFQIFGWNW